MINKMHYTRRTTAMTGTLINTSTTYEVYYDESIGIAYEVRLLAPQIYEATAAHLAPTAAPQAEAIAPPDIVPNVPEAIAPQELLTWWNARIVNYTSNKRLEYDKIKKIYYQTKQTMKVDRALYNLQEDVEKFLAANPQPVEPLVVGNTRYPGYKLYTLTIWIDPKTKLPVRRLNVDRGYMILDEFVYHSLNNPLPAGVFELPKPAEAIADFDLYPEAPMLPRFERIEDAENPQYGVWVSELIDAIERHTILNQWEYGPFATIDLPWLTELPMTIYRRKTEDAFPPIVVEVNAPMYPTIYFLISYDFLGYVVAGHTDDPDYDLSKYEKLPIEAEMMLDDFVPLYAAPSYEKAFVVENFINSIKANDFFISAFRMGCKYFDLLVKNFSFHENEGYLMLNVYGKEYWDNANMESMFNFIVTGRLVDAHITPITIYALNVMKRLGIYNYIHMPVYEQIPAVEEPPVIDDEPGLGTM